MRAIRRAFLVIALLLVVGFVVFGYWTGAPWLSTITTPAAADSATGTAAEKTRERGAALGEKAARVAQEVGKTVDDAAITAKIKAKMTLDDSVRARSIDVSTTGPTVTLSGTVRSAAEHDRAVTLARETDGVTRVVDHLVLLRKP
jgi:hyperosmotically inducible protein